MHCAFDCRDCLAFATEPVLLSLANILDDESSDSSNNIEEVEIKYGLIQVSTVQRNLCACQQSTTIHVHVIMSRLTYLSIFF